MHPETHHHATSILYTLYPTLYTHSLRQANLCTGSPIQTLCEAFFFHVGIRRAVAEARSRVAVLCILSALHHRAACICSIAGPRWMIKGYHGTLVIMIKRELQTKRLKPVRIESSYFKNPTNLFCSIWPHWKELYECHWSIKKIIRRQKKEIAGI